jgi:tRNA-2-methylthio-N6-dimethylallyladenosine synthase
VVTARYDKLVALQESISWEQNKRLLGSEVEVLISTGDGKKDAATGRVSGRSRDGRLVHIANPQRRFRPGDVVTATVTYAAPHHLVADGPVRSHRPWRGYPAQATGQPAAGDAPRRPTADLLTIGRRPGL